MSATGPRGLSFDFHRAHPVALLRLILHRVRQRAFVVLNPYVIPRVDPAVARVASEKMPSLTDAPPIGALAEHGTAWSRFFE
jgi:hypothetical protein